MKRQFPNARAAIPPIYLSGVGPSPGCFSTLNRFRSCCLRDADFDISVWTNINVPLRVNGTVNSEHIGANLPNVKCRRCAPSRNLSGMCGVCDVCGVRVCCFEIARYMLGISSKHSYQIQEGQRSAHSRIHARRPNNPNPITHHPFPRKRKTESISNYMFILFGQSFSSMALASSRYRFAISPLFVSLYVAYLVAFVMHTVLRVLLKVSKWLRFSSAIAMPFC